MRSWLGEWLYRAPFTGRSARRYARAYRHGFGDFYQSLMDRWHSELASARTVLDIGSGTGVFAAQLRSRYPDMYVVALEPSVDLATAVPGVSVVRARAEALPLASKSADLAIYMSSMRHVADRFHALAEVHRVTTPAARLYIVELDPSASRERIAHHRAGIRSPLARMMFGALVVRTAPPANHIASIAHRAGWRCTDIAPDPEQPVYIMRLRRAPIPPLGGRRAPGAETDLRPEERR